MKALADAFMKVVMGGRWEDELPLPWTEASSYLPRAENDAISIYCDIANALKADPDAKVVATINAVASTRCVSFEKARAAYYKYKEVFSKIQQQT